MEIIISFQKKKSIFALLYHVRLYIGSKLYLSSAKLALSGNFSNSNVMQSVEPMHKQNIDFTNYFFNQRKRSSF